MRFWLAYIICFLLFLLVAPIWMVLSVIDLAFGDETSL